MNRNIVNNISVRELTKLFREKFYAIKYINNDSGEPLKPFDFTNANNEIIIKGFKVYFDEEDKVTTLLIGVDIDQYNFLLNNKEVGANITDKEWIKETNKWKINHV